MPYICQNKLPIAPWMSPVTKMMPGIQPLGSEPFFLLDDVFNKQMRYKDTLINKKRSKVYFNDLKDDSVVNELLSFVVSRTRENLAYKITKKMVRRPDGVVINLNKDDPLIAAARLVQEDLLILENTGGEHILRAAVLCFPASWMLSEKANKTLTNIHGPVRNYDNVIAPRIERMFSNLRPEIPIWRANYLFYKSHELHQPVSEKEEKGNPHKIQASYMRVERQTLLKLAVSKRIVFSIHTFVVPYVELSPEQRASLIL